MIDTSPVRTAVPRRGPASSTLAVLLPVALACLVSCGNGSGTTVTNAADGGPASGETDAASDAGPAPLPGSIAGTADGTPFTAVVTSLWAGAPDSAATTVVYMFSGTVDCAALKTPGWDTRITNGTQVLEMKMLGVQPQTYKVVTGPMPGPGEAAVNYTLSSTQGTPKETSATSGTVTLDALVPGSRVSGSMDLSFGTNKLTGKYDAAFCPEGHEP